MNSILNDFFLLLWLGSMLLVVLVITSICLWYRFTEWMSKRKKKGKKSQVLENNHDVVVVEKQHYNDFIKSQKLQDDYRKLEQEIETIRKVITDKESGNRALLKENSKLQEKCRKLQQQKTLNKISRQWEQSYKHLEKACVAVRELLIKEKQLTKKMQGEIDRLYHKIDRLEKEKVSENCQSRTSSMYKKGNNRRCNSTEVQAILAEIRQDFYRHQKHWVEHIDLIGNYETRSLKLH